MPNRPRIAIATGTSRTTEGNFQAQISYSYLYSVLAAGGAPFLLPPLDDPEALDACLEAAEGLVLSGGPDLDPSLFGQSPHPMLEPAKGPRASFDVRLCRRAFEFHIPILGICRGCQVVNVAFGGSLHQDILTAFPESPLVHRRRIPPYYVPHPVRVEPGSLLRSVVGADVIETNSAHHQAVDEPGEGLRPVAWTDDGIIEGIEWVGDSRFLLGIQWHPEKMAEESDGPHRALFHALVEAAQRRTQAAESAPEAR